MKTSLTPRRFQGIRSRKQAPDPQQTIAVEASLSEDVIKKVALRFMRQYYKFRLRYDEQPVVAKYDLEGVGGIVADGYYSFKKTDGKSFVATFEATSRKKRNEVLFRPQNRILFWDGLAMASLAALVFSAINHIYNYHQLNEREFFTRAGMVLGVMAVSMGIFYLIARNFRRYRYIYAVEQFKRYHADEQWVVIASDVFASKDTDSERYAKKQAARFNELKEQCVLNGFGLLKVDANLDTKIVVTPSRQDIFLGKRKRVRFMDSQAVAKVENEQEFGLKGMLRKILPQGRNNTQNVQRFRKNFVLQGLLTFGCFLLIGFMWMKEMELSDFQTVDQQTYRDELAVSKSNNLREQPEVLGDSSFTTNTNRLEQEEFNRSIWPSQKQQKEAQAAKEKAEKPAPPAKPAAPIDATEIYINSNDQDKAIAYDCARFYNFDAKKYIVEEGLYPDWKEAKWRLKVLRKNNLESAALLLACFEPNEPGYVIYLGMIYNSMEEASQYIESLRGAPKTLIKNVEKMKIRTISPPR